MKNKKIIYTGIIGILIIGIITATTIYLPKTSNLQGYFNFTPNTTHPTTTQKTKSITTNLDLIELKNKINTLNQEIKKQNQEIKKIKKTNNNIASFLRESAPTFCRNWYIDKYYIDQCVDKTIHL